MESENRNQFWDYMIRSLTGFGSLALAILFAFLLYNLKGILSGLKSLLSILTPFIYGFAIAYVLTPLCNWLEQILEKCLKKPWKKERRRLTVIRACSVGVTILIALILVTLLMVTVLPQLFTSVYNLVNSLPGASNRLVHWVEGLLENHPDLQAQVVEVYNDIGGNALNWVQNTFMPRFQDFVANLSSGIIGVVVILKNMILGVIISIYLLYNRRLYASQATKMLFGMVPPKAANYILFLCRDTNEIFNGFIMGKLVDSLIIGVICFVGSTILRFPYALLISTIVGVTNIIPYFGPFFGAIPSAILVMTVSPLQGLYFLIFVLALQQLDGNVIGPRILGGTTGLSSFWVLISLLLFGGMFGFVGMIIGVPVFAVLYDLVKRGIRHLLRKKNLPLDSQSYDNVDHIDPATGKLVACEGDHPSRHEMIRREEKKNPPREG